MQTVYRQEMEIALEGQIADISPRAIESYAAEGEGVAIGRAVVQGTGDGQCKAISAAGDHILGVVVHSHARLVDAPKAKDIVNVMRQGGVYVRPAEAVTPASPVHVLFEGADAGRFAASGGVQLTGARYEGSADKDELVKLVINLPAAVVAPEEGGD